MGILIECAQQRIRFSIEMLICLILPATHLHMLATNNCQLYDDRKRRRQQQRQQRRQQPQQRINDRCIESIYIVERCIRNTYEYE